MLLVLFLYHLFPLSDSTFIPYAREQLSEWGISTKKQRTGLQFHTPSITRFHTRNSVNNGVWLSIYTSAYLIFNMDQCTRPIIALINDCVYLYRDPCIWQNLARTMAGAHFADGKLVSQLANANTQFALDLFKNVAKASDNIFLSPASISAALAMTRLGAKANTQAEMDAVLKWTDLNDKVNNAFEDYLNVLNAKEASYTLTMANRIFVSNKLKLLEEFVKKTETHFKADAVVANFDGKPAEEKQKINEWVEAQTRGKIKDVISDIEPLTRLILVNAIYFKGNWKRQFDPRDTVKGMFQMTSGERIQVDMMRMNKPYPMERNEQLKCQVLELPYVNDDISMFILLPFEVKGLASLVDSLNATKLSQALSVRARGAVEITLPKFVVKSEFGLEKVLPSMGMVDAFDERKADFSGMTGSADLHISQVIHKTFLEVNEEGSEAAAATAVVMQTRAILIARSFVADHPFMFVIRDNRADMVLFIGKLEKP